MTWRVISASEAGTSHLERSVPCQDECQAGVGSTPSGSHVLWAFVSDGAGSAPYGKDGAFIATNEAADFTAARIHQGEIEPCGSFAHECFCAVRAAIDTEASVRALVPRDLACTFLGVISKSTGTLVFQVGDGGIAVDVGEGLEVSVPPMAGEYANMTNFATDHDAEAVMAIKTYPAQVRRAALFSDGLQSLVMDLASNTPHLPLFTALFGVLESAGTESEETLNYALRRFLLSAAVNERTDDDKTLVLAVSVL